MSAAFMAGWKIAAERRRPWVLLSSYVMIMPPAVTVSTNSTIPLSNDGQRPAAPV